MSQAGIPGNNLTGATAVSFNGSPAASFTVNATGSAITATVPDGATTGPIQVTQANPFGRVAGAPESPWPPWAASHAWSKTAVYIVILIKAAQGGARRPGWSATVSR